MKVDKLIPEVYYKESRDFAYIARTLEVIFNYMKTGADCVNVNIDNENIEGNIVDLLVNTLGFDLRHEYVNKDLIVIASAFSSLLKYKGTTSAIELAVKLLLNSQNIKNQADFDFCILDSENAEININIPDVLSDIILLEDLFDYILPVGVTYKFTKFSNTKNRKETYISANVVMDNDLSINNAGGIKSVYAFDTNIGVIKSDDSDDMKHIGGMYTGVVAVDLSDPSAAIATATNVDDTTDASSDKSEDD